MRCPTLAELPPPPTGKTGWPWTEESPQLPDTMPDSRPWPRVSIVTPSYNQGQYIEETIRSVLLQGYPNLEYIIMDGGSTDNSVEIIRKYEPWLNHWESEKDRGQADAINKGWSRCSGDVLAWLNSDDYYINQAAVATQVGELVTSESIGLVYGDCRYINAEGFVVGKYHSKSFSYIGLLRYCFISQPTVFIKQTVVEQAGPLNVSLRFALDYEYWLRCASITDFKYIPSPIANYRLHVDSKTVSSMLEMAFEASGVVCANIFGYRSNVLKEPEKKYVLSGTLLSVAMQAVSAHKLGLGYRLARRAFAINSQDPRFIFLLLTLIDYFFGSRLHVKGADLLYFLHNRKYQRL